MTWEFRGVKGALLEGLGGGPSAAEIVRKGGTIMAWQGSQYADGNILFDTV